ncbi:MAG: hypothetical protein ACKOEW_04555, partial [Methylocystis sp.]
MKRQLFKFVAPALLLTLFNVNAAFAYCMFTCDPTEAHARQIFENLLKKRFDKAGKILEFKQ